MFRRKCRIGIVYVVDAVDLIFCVGRSFSREMCQILLPCFGVHIVFVYCV